MKKMTLGRYPDRTITQKPPRKIRDVKTCYRLPLTRQLTDRNVSCRTVITQRYIWGKEKATRNRIIIDLADEVHVIFLVYFLMLFHFHLLTFMKEFLLYVHLGFTALPEHFTDIKPTDNYGWEARMYVEDLLHKARSFPPKIRKRLESAC